MTIGLSSPASRRELNSLSRLETSSDGVHMQWMYLDSTALVRARSLTVGHLTGVNLMNVLSALGVSLHGHHLKSEVDLPASVASWNVTIAFVDGCRDDLTKVRSTCHMSITLSASLGKSKPACATHTNDRASCPVQKRRAPSIPA